MNNEKLNEATTGNTDFSALLGDIKEVSLLDKLNTPHKIKEIKPAEATSSFLGNMYRLFNNLDEYSYLKLLQFPKAEKFTITKEIKQILLNIERILVEISLKHHKRTSITALDIETELLRKYISRSHTRKYINDNTRDIWLRMTNSFGDEVRSIVQGLKNNKNR